MVTYLDDGAWRDDGPAAAALGRILRRIGAEVHADRRPAAGWGTPEARALRLASVDRAWLEVGTIRLPAAERVSTVRVDLRGSVEFSGESAGTPAVRIYLDATESGAPVRVPRATTDDWIVYDAGDTVSTYVDVDVRHIRGRECVIVLWVWSYVSDTAEGTGTIDEYRHVGGFSYTVSTGSAPSSSPPERALRITTDPEAKGEELPLGFSGALWEVGYSNGAEMWTDPPIPVFVDTDSGGSEPVWSSHAMGVLVLSGAQCTIQAGTLALPAERLYGTDEPVSTLVQSAADYASAKARGYQPAIWCGAGIGDFSGVRQLWPIRVGTDIHTVAANWRPYRCAIVDEWTPTMGGIEATGRFAAHAYRARFNRADLRLIARLSLYAIGATPDGATPIVSGDSVPFVVPVARFETSNFGAEYSRLGRTLWGVAAFASWQSRGLISGEAAAGTDWVRQTVEVRCQLTDLSDLTEPLRVALEVAWDVDAAAGDEDDAAAYPPSMLALISSGAWAMDL